jgi:hypothetical protein
MHPAGDVAFELPNLLAGSRRDYSTAHTMQVSMARGAVVVARFGPTSPPCPACPDAGGRPMRRAPRAGKGVVP